MQRRTLELKKKPVGNRQEFKHNLQFSTYCPLLMPAVCDCAASNMKAEGTMLAFMTSFLV